MNEHGYDNDRVKSARHEDDLRRTWIIQVHRPEAINLVESLQAGDAYFTTPIDRHLLDVRVGDVVLLWVTGRGSAAGIFGAGWVTDSMVMAEHRRDYGDAGSPRVLRPSIEVFLEFAKDWVMISRPELRAREGFDAADFELFTMPNRPNAFAVNEPQHRVIFDGLLAAASGARS